MFQRIAVKRPKLNKFNLSHEVKLSCNMGDLIPVNCMEVLPGDRFRINTEIMMRLAPMLAPIMHRVNVYTHSFFVPVRLLWSESKDFFTGGRLGTTEPIPPYITSWSVKSNSLDGNGTLWDYLGLPPLGSSSGDAVNVSALPFQAYNLIYDEYYRDQNVSASVINPLNSGDNSGEVGNTLCVMRKRAWEKDRYTSALPFSQRGPEVGIPVEFQYMDQSIVRDTAGNTVAAAPVETDLNSDLVGDLGAAADIRIENLDTDAVQVPIEDLRLSARLQEWLELSARAGSRYVEQLEAFFGVKRNDARLQRPEYLGGGRQAVVISEVLQTSETDVNTPLGEMAGHGVSAGGSNKFSFRVPEHGYIMTIMSVLPRTAYQQGIPKYFLRTDKFDYFWPQFAHLGEEPIQNQELYFDSTASSAVNEGTFGYTPRYSDYKYLPSRVAGDFRTTLDYWHMGRIFTALPVLSNGFIEADPTHRIFANTTPTDHKLWCQLYHRIDALRPMPYYGIPRL